MSARSYLYVPGDQPDKLVKALTLPADAIIADLEDAVPPANKDAARAAVASWLAEAREPMLWVRVNSGDLLEQDAGAFRGAKGVAGFVVPKVSSAADIARARAALGDEPLCALIETASGVLDARAIAAEPGVVRLALGEADLCAELAIEPSADARELLAIRTQIVLASVAAGIERPVAPVSTDFRDLDALRTTTQGLRRMGFGSRAAIHPAQLDVINDVFTPSDEEVARAERIVARAAQAGGAATTDDDGRMIDEAVVRGARDVLSRARRGSA